MAAVALYAAVWGPLVAFSPIAAAELSQMAVTENIPIGEKPMAIRMMGARHDGFNVCMSEARVASHFREGKNFVWSYDNFYGFGIWTSCYQMQSRRLWGNVAANHEENSREVNITGRSAVIDDRKRELWISSFFIPPSKRVQIKPRVTFNIVYDDERPFQISERTFGDVGGFFSDSPKQNSRSEKQSVEKDKQPVGYIWGFFRSLHGAAILGVLGGIFIGWLAAR